MRTLLRAFSWVPLCLLLLAPALHAAQVHVVAKGQTLGGIARRYGVTIAALTRANEIERSSTLRVGQELTIPDKDSSSRGRTRSASRVHVVQSGQTLGAIARRYAVTIAELAAANGMRRGDTLRVGRELIIPEKRPQGTSPAAQGQRYAVVSGDTLGSIAMRFDVSISSLARVNRIQERDLLRIGQELAIPPPEDAPSRTPALPRASSAGMLKLEVPGTSPVYYFEPAGAGRLGLRPVLMYLHGRGGNPAHDCQRWAPIARPFGWLVCPSGPGHRNGGRTWNNSWVSGQHTVHASLMALRKKYGRRVQLYGNTLIGFSEGAFVAMNVGVRDARAFNRLFILGASDGYLGARGPELIAACRSRLRRVYLLTGERDAVVHETRRAGQWFRNNRVPVRVVTPSSLAHEVAVDSESSLYRGALSWLASG